MQIKEFIVDEDSLKCDYRNCRHIKSEHDGKKCKCRHAQFMITGVGFEPKAIIIFDKKEGIKDIEFR